MEPENKTDTSNNGSTATTTATTATADDGKGPVPYSRFESVNSAKSKAEARVQELEAKLGEHTSTISGLQTQISGWQSKERSWTEERSVYSAGITDSEGVGVARFLHAQLPEADRPAIGDWLSGLRSDPTKAPKALQPYLSGPATSTSTAATPTPTPKPNATVVAPTAAGSVGTAGGITAQQIKALREEAVRTGNWAKVEELKPQIIAAATRSRS